MDPDSDLLRFLDLLESRYVTGISTSSAIRLRTAFLCNLPWIEHYVRSSHQSEWSLNEYIERLYRRLRSRAERIDDFAQAIELGMRSLVYEDLRNQARRFRRATSVYFQQAKTQVDPGSLRFVAAIARQDKLNKFTALLDSWTATALCEIYLEKEDVPRAIIAEGMGMTESAFNKRYERGMKRAMKKYLKIYGSF